MSRRPKLNEERQHILNKDYRGMIEIGKRKQEIYRILSKRYKISLPTLRKYTKDEKARQDGKEARQEGDKIESKRLLDVYQRLDAFETRFTEYIRKQEDYRSAIRGVAENIKRLLEISYEDQRKGS